MRVYLGEGNNSIGVVIPEYSNYWFSVLPDAALVVYNPCGIKEFKADLQLAIQDYGFKLICLSEAKFFKAITQCKDVTRTYSIKQSAYGIDALYVINPKRFIYSPELEEVQNRIIKSINTVPDFNIIKSAYYPNELVDVLTSLVSLHQHSVLTIDIETRSLDFTEAGIETIAFAWDQHHGLAFTVDRSPHRELIREGLKRFLSTYKGTAVYHNANYDLKVLTYELFMQNSLDFKGMVDGIETLTRNFEDTKIISYLVLNSTSDISLSLKDLSQEFAGNYGVDDFSIPDTELLEYNLKDSLCTFYVYNKYRETLTSYNLDYIYLNIMLKSVRVLLQAELHGMPINSDTLNTLAYDSISIKENLITRLNSNPDVLKALVYIRQEESDKQHKKWKKKTVDISYFNYINFNPNSSNHVITLLHTVLQLPVLETTATGLPSTSKETLEKLKTLHAHDVIDDLLEYNAIDKIISTFIPALQNSKYKEDGWSYLHGSFNIGGTVSGRLSCVAPWTPILTRTGTKPITDIRIGDSVWTHKERWRPVIDTIFKGYQDMVDLYLDNGQVFTCTADHRVLKPDGTWVTVGELVDEPFLAGRRQSVIKITKVNYRGSTPVYDLTVQEDSSYLSCGFYSHNSSSPNLQNIPSNSKYGKLIKQCFQAPAGKLMVGADFASLESMISALLTRDPMKEAVFTDGFDSHCLASYFYFKEQMPDITEELQGYFDD